MKVLSVLLLLALSFSSQAKCLLSDLSYKDISLKKVVIQEPSKENDWFYVKLEVDGKLIGGDGFSCSPEKDYSICYGNDESGRILINKSSIKVLSLKIRIDDKKDFQFKGAKEWIPFQKVSCSPYFK